ncbi:MAG TPA: hypothetical protein VKR06_13355 [Ktedonosporobacter sp.]|nr:hypothetical protein [Ktedonosporobacter sp.]
MREETESIVATIAFKTIGTHEVSLWEHGFVDIEDERFEYKLDYKLDHARLPLEEAYWLLDFLNTHLPPQSHITSEAVGTHTFTLREDGNSGDCRRTIPIVRGDQP